MTIVPCQDRTAVRELGISRDQCESAAWATSAGGERYRGAVAINAALAYALDSDLPIRLYELRWIQWLEDRVYATITALRGRLPGIKPFCLEHPDRCAGERD